MMGFLYKDLCLMRKQIAYILFLTVVYTGLTVSGAFPSLVLPAVVTMLALIYPLNAFSWDDLAHWDRFAAAAPAGRRNMVAGRYLFVILLVAASSVFVTILLALLHLLGLLDGPLTESFLTVPACALAGLLMNAVVLPLLYQFGAEKARIISVAVFASIFGACALIGFAGTGLELRGIPSRTMGLGMVLLAAVTAAALAISFALSLKIYQRKEL